MPRWLPPQPGTEGGGLRAGYLCVGRHLVVVAAGSVKTRRAGGFYFIKTPLCGPNVQPRPGCRLPRWGVLTHAHTRIHERAHALRCICFPFCVHIGVYYVLLGMYTYNCTIFLKKKQTKKQKKFHLLYAGDSSLANEEFVSLLWAKKVLWWKSTTPHLCVSSWGPLGLLQEQLQLSLKTNGPSDNC